MTEDQMTCTTIYTTLQKLCNSNISALLWNLVHVMPDSTWINYCHAVNVRIASGVDPEEALTLAAEDLDYGPQCSHYTAMLKLAMYDLPKLEIEAIAKELADMISKKEQESNE